jgi:hypothetical protein
MNYEHSAAGIVERVRPESAFDTISYVKGLIIQSLTEILEMTWLDKGQIVSHNRSTTFSREANTSLWNPRFRISFQICSIGFISGVYGGI